MCPEIVKIWPLQGPVSQQFQQPQVVAAPVQPTAMSLPTNLLVPTAPATAAAPAMPSLPLTPQSLEMLKLLPTGYNISRIPMEASHFDFLNINVNININVLETLAGY